MDAFAGIYDPGAEPAAIGAVLARMQRVLELPLPRTQSHSASAVGAGCVVLDHRGASPAAIARDRDRGIWLAFAGQLYAADELATRPREGEEDGGPARLCLDHYLSEGADFVSRLNGDFCLVLYHEAERRLRIATDRFGYRPLFLATSGSKLLFASEMKAILAVLETTPAVDGIGLLECVRHGWPQGDRTWLEPIRLASPGTWYELTPGETRKRRYFRFGFHRGDLSLADYVDGLAQKLRQAMRRTTSLPGRIGLPLSGGLDSRALLLAGDGQARLTFTFGDPASREVRYAVELARLAGVEHLRLPYQPGYLGRLLLPIVWRTEGLLPFASVTYTSMHFHAALAEHADVLVYGHCGDALTGAHLPHGILFGGTKERLIQRIFRNYNPVPEVVWKSVLRPDFYSRFAPDLYEALRQTFTDIDQDELADVLDVWDMENRQRRGVFASTSVDRHRFGLRAPFLEHELVDHLAQATPAWRLHQFAYKRTIATAFPSAASVPWTHTGSRVPRGRLGDLAGLARGYLERRLSLRRGRPDPRTFRDLGAHTREDPALAQAIRDFAASPYFPGEVFDRRGIEEVVRRHWEGRENLTHLVSMLATFAAAYRLLMCRPQAVPPEAVPPA